MFSLLPGFSFRLHRVCFGPCFLYAASQPLFPAFSKFKNRRKLQRVGVFFRVFPAFHADITELPPNRPFRALSMFFYGRVRVCNGG